MLRLQTPTRPLVLTPRLDAGTLESGHEYGSDPSAIPCLCNRHMGACLGVNCGKRNPSTGDPRVQHTSFNSSAKTFPTLLSAVSSWVLWVGSMYFYLVSMIRPLS